MSHRTIRLCVLNSNRIKSSPHIKLCYCYMSTQPSTPAGNNGDPNAWRKFVTTIRTFGQGAKLLIGDIRKMIKVKSTMGEFKLSGTIPMTKPNDSITLDDVRFVYKTTADLKQTLPTLILFCIPLLGYVAPFLALMFPEQLLSSHFWSEQQKKDLLDKSILKRQDSILSQTQSATNNDVLHSAITVFQNEDVTYNTFIDKTNGITSIEQLSTAHLQLLSYCWGVSSSIIPLSWFQCRKLRKHLHYIQSCDWILQRRGLEDININLMNELVRERLPLFYPTNANDLTMKKWLEMKSSIKDEAVNELFLAHMVLLKDSTAIK